MARPKDPNLERAWRQRIHRQTSSGLSIAAFCRREGVSARSFYAWKVGSRRGRFPHVPSRRCLFRSTSILIPSQADPVLGRGVEMELPHQVRLRFDAPPEPEWLGRVVAALAGLPQQGGHAMIMLPSAVRIFLCTRPTDLRKSFDGLTGLGPGVLRPGPVDRPSLPLPQPPQGSDQDPLL